MPNNTSSGGFGTRIYFIPNTGMDPKSSQILKGKGYVTINLRGAHYRSEGNLWQQIFGGSDKVCLSTQVTHQSASNAVSCASIEEVRQIGVGKPYYFGSGRLIALKLPTDCDSIDMAVTISAVKHDNLSGALDILNSGELKGTLQLAPPAVSQALAIANVVKKLLTSTDPMNSLQGDYAGRLSTSASDNPIRDYCVVQGTIILIFRESEDDTSLDDLDPSKLTIDGDGLKYDGQPLSNTYAMFQVSFDSLRGEDPSTQWASIFLAAEQALDALVTPTSDADKQKAWAAAFAIYQQAVKLLGADPTYTQDEESGIAAAHFLSLKKKYNDLAGQPTPPQHLLIHQLASLTNTLDSDNVERVANDYLARLSRAKVSLPGHWRRER